MPLTTAAEAELRSLLRAFRAAHAGFVVPGGQGKALEAWVLMKLAETIAGWSPNWTALLRRGDGSPLPAGAPFDLAASHSGIRPSHPSAPGYVLLAHTRYPNRRFELHASLQWQGRSGARHECDVSVVPSSIAEALRTHGGGYPHGLPIVAVECKDKTGIGTLDETRQTVARLFDLALVTQPVPGWSCRIYETRTHGRWGRRGRTYRGLFEKGAFAIVRAGAFQTGAGTLASHYHIRHHPSVYAGSGPISLLQSHIRTALARVGGF